MRPRGDRPQNHRLQRRDVVLASVSIVKPKAGNQKPPNNLAYDAREEDYYRPDHLAKRGERLLAQPMFK
jgi:hypothetical protein